MNENDWKCGVFIKKCTAASFERVNRSGAVPIFGKEPLVRVNRFWPSEPTCGSLVRFRRFHGSANFFRGFHGSAIWPGLEHVATVLVPGRFSSGSGWVWFRVTHSVAITTMLKMNQAIKGLNMGRKRVFVNNIINA